MLSDEIADVLLGSDRHAARRRNGKIEFKCPRHEDSKPSAWMKGGTWGCFACGFKESITTLAAETGIQLKGKSGDYGVEEYAAEKGFPAFKLREFGLSTAESNGRGVLRIPYYDETGKELRARLRAGAKRWWEGRNGSVYLYGLDRLADAREGAQVIIVEGESDCHAAWLGGFNCVGVPGATTWRSDWKAKLDGFEVFVFEEPDQAGTQFVASIAKDFPNARLITSRDAGTKDIADLYRASASKFGEVLAGLMTSATRIGTPKPPVTFDAFVGRRLDELLRTKQLPIDSVPTPLPSWSRVCGDAGGRTGLARGWHVLAAAKTGLGKTIIALNAAWVAAEAGERVGYISLEMDADQLATRYMAIVSGEPVWRLEEGSSFDILTYKRAQRRINELHERTGGVLYVNRQPIFTLEDVSASIRFNHEVHGCRFFVVDYIQLAGNANDPESITAVSHEVRRLTKELRVVTLALSQFNRQTSVSHDRPTSQGLMGGSALENDSDMVVLIDHSRMERAPAPVDGWTGYALVDKNRHGSQAEIPILFDRSTLRLRERMDDEMPSQEVAAA